MSRTPRIFCLGGWKWHAAVLQLFSLYHLRSLFIEKNPAPAHRGDLHFKFAVGVAHVATGLCFVEIPADFSFFGREGDSAVFIDHPDMIDPLQRAYLLDYLIGPFPVVHQHFIMRRLHYCFAQFIGIGNRRFQEHGFKGGDIDVGKKHHEDKEDEAGADGQF